MKDPRKRYQTPAEMLKDLQRFAKNKPITKPVEAYFATKDMLANTQDWLSKKVNAADLRTATFALIMVAVILGLIAMWFLFGSPSSDPPARFVPDATTAPSSSETHQSKLRNLLPSVLAPTLTTLRDTQGNVIYSSHAPNVRLAVEEALRRHIKLTNVNLSGQNLAALSAADGDFVGADFSNAIMIGCLLEGAKLDKANFTGVSLNGADLTNVYAPEANFSDTVLIGTNLTAGKFIDADFSGSQIKGANLTNADLTNCDFDLVKARNVNFSGAHGKGIHGTAASVVGCRFDQSTPDLETVLRTYKQESHSPF
jgi:uncharacterized protein YjbI with pentapeptide repeats